MELVASRKMIYAKFSDKVAAFSHFRIDSSEDIPIDSMEGAVIPVQALIVVFN
jgi:hypothetical protein